MEEKVLSVIVAMYNSSSTLDKLIYSLKTQKFSGVEYIFVDDASSDDSVEKVRRLLPEARIIVLDVHGGTSVSKQRGFEAARGKYVLYIDSDDYIEPGMFADMYSAAVGEDYDAVFTPYWEDKGMSRKKVGFNKEVYELNDMPIHTLYFSMWNKLLKREILEKNGINFFEGIDCWEDLGIISRFMTFNPKIKYLKTPYYHYVIRKNSITHSSKKKILGDHLNMASVISQWMSERGLERKYEEFLLYLKFISKVKYARLPDRNFKLWKRTFPEVNSSIMSLRHIKLKYRIAFYLLNKVIR